LFVFSIYIYYIKVCYPHPPFFLKKSKSRFCPLLEKSEMTSLYGSKYRTDNPEENTTAVQNDELHRNLSSIIVCFKWWIDISARLHKDKWIAYKDKEENDNEHVTRFDSLIDLQGSRTVDLGDIPSWITEE
jgi:hypothetical protein